MEIRTGVEAFDFEVAAVVVEEISDETGVDFVVEDDGGGDADSERINVGTNADSGEGALIGGDGGYDVVFFAAFGGRGVRGCGE